MLGVCGGEGGGGERMKGAEGEEGKGREKEAINISIMGVGLTPLTVASPARGFGVWRGGGAGRGRGRGIVRG